MDKKEIKKLIEEEKKQFIAFLRIANRIGIEDAEIEKQSNFYLDKISELKKKLKNK